MFWVFQLNLCPFQKLTAKDTVGIRAILRGTTDNSRRSGFLFWKQSRELMLLVVCIKKKKDSDDYKLRNLLAEAWESLCTAFSGVKSSPPASQPLSSLVHSRTDTMLRSGLPPPAKNCPGLSPQAGQDVQHKEVVLQAYKHMYVSIDLLILHKDIFSLFVSSLLLLFHLSAMHFAKARTYEMHFLRREFSLQVPDSQIFSQGSTESELFVP